MVTWSHRHYADDMDGYSDLRDEANIRSYKSEFVKALSTSGPGMRRAGRLIERPRQRRPPRQRDRLRTLPPTTQHTTYWAGSSARRSEAPFPSVRSLATPRVDMDNLPLQTTSFVGRRAAAADVRELLSTEKLVVLTGVGGVGKTRLAIEVAGTLRRKFGDGVCFVSLAALSQPSLVTLSVSDALGLGSKVKDPLDAVIDYLRDRYLLLVIDNCEHLVDAAAALVQSLVSSCPRLRVLATTREPLRVAGEHLYQVLPFAVPGEDDHSDEPSATSAAVLLFRERARAVAGDFVLTPPNLKIINNLCRRLDGLPLAIELTAVLMRSLPLGEVAASMEDRDVLLQSQSRTGLPRQRSLRATLTWSFDLCTPLEQTLWSRLSVFSGDFDIDGAQTVCADGYMTKYEFLLALSGLVDKSIATRADGRTSTRYHLLGVVREYGKDRLDQAGDYQEYRLRHRDYFVDLAHRLKKEWFGPNQIEIFEKVHAELSNIRLALNTCLIEADDRHLGLRCGADLWAFWFEAGKQFEGALWLKRLVDRDTEVGPERAEALWVLAFVTILTGDMAQAGPILDECIEFSETLKLPHLQAHVAYARALSAMAVLSASEGICAARDAVYLERRVPAPNPFLTMSMLALGFGLIVTGDAHGGEALLVECQEISEEHEERWIRSWSMMFRGLSAWNRSEYTEASELLRASLREARFLRDQLGIALQVEFLAWIAQSTHAFHRAARLLGGSQHLWEAHGAYLVGASSLLKWHENSLEDTRHAIPAKLFLSDFKTGAALTLDDLVSYALEEDTVGEADVRRSGRHADQALLTVREWQVAELVSQGKSNKQIGELLVISSRTVDSHLAHILQKLGLTSRSQVAVWLTERRHLSALSGSDTYAVLRDSANRPTQMR